MTKKDGMKETDVCRLTELLRLNAYWGLIQKDQPQAAKVLARWVFG